MSINWVMLDRSVHPPFVPLPSERLVFESPARVSLAITLPSPSSAISCANGKIYLTTQRIIYLPKTPTPDLESFSAPLEHISNSHVHTPFFGPNAWVGDVKIVRGGGLMRAEGGGQGNVGWGEVKLKLTFREGGTFEFFEGLVREKERLAGEANDLPRYEERESRMGAVGAVGGPGGVVGVAVVGAGGGEEDRPPGYEEAQMEGVLQGLRGHAPAE